MPQRHRVTEITNLGRRVVQIVFFWKRLKMIRIFTILVLLSFFAGKFLFENDCDDILVDECIGMVLRVNLTSFLILINLTLVTIKIYIEYIKDSNQKLHLKIIQLTILIISSIFFSYFILFFLFMFS